ncbi:hypothetical protein PHLH7_33050 [Pseudomonas sp. Ost2]|nr:hypothetical protein PHLH7_33050 [Pseudomonas sp. Ost2]
MKEQNETGLTSHTFARLFQSVSRANITVNMCEDRLRPPEFHRVATFISRVTNDNWPLSTAYSLHAVSYFHSKQTL